MVRLDVETDKHRPLPHMKNIRNVTVIMIDNSKCNYRRVNKEELTQRIHKVQKEKRTCTTIERDAQLGRLRGGVKDVEWSLNKKDEYSGLRKCNTLG